jgi:hypothetical protein
MRKVFTRRRLLLSGAAAATAVAATQPRAAVAASQPAGGLAEILDSGGKWLQVRILDSGTDLAVPAKGFSPDWEFEPGDLVFVRPTDAGPAAEPYLQVTENRMDGLREVWIFSAAGTSHLAKTIDLR